MNSLVLDILALILRRVEGTFARLVCKRWHKICSKKVFFTEAVANDATVNFALSIGMPVTQQITAAAIQRGDVNMFNYLLARNFPITTLALEKAAYTGRLDLLIGLENYFDKDFPYLYDRNCLSFQDRIFAAAVSGGNKRVISYLWNKSYCPSLETVIAGAKKGDVNLLKKIFDSAIVNFNQNLIEYYKDDVVGAAIESRSLECVGMITCNLVEISSQSLIFCLSIGAEEIFDFLLPKVVRDCHHSSKLMFYLIDSEKLELFVKLLKYGFPVTELLLFKLAEIKNLELFTLACQVLCEDSNSELDLVTYLIQSKKFNFLAELLNNNCFAKLIFYKNNYDDSPVIKHRKTNGLMGQLMALHNIFMVRCPDHLHEDKEAFFGFLAATGDLNVIELLAASDKNLFLTVLPFILSSGNINAFDLFVKLVPQELHKSVFTKCFCFTIYSKNISMVHRYQEISNENVSFDDFVLAFETGFAEFWKNYISPELHQALIPSVIQLCDEDDLEFIFKKANFPWCDSYPGIAASAGNNIVIDWAIIHNLPCDLDLITKVIQGSADINVLQFLYGLGFRVNQATFLAAITKVDFAVLKWLKSINCPYDSNKLSQELSFFDEPNKIIALTKWLVLNGYRVDVENFPDSE